MGRRGRLLLVFAAVALIATPFLVYPNGAPAKYEYTVETQESYPVGMYLEQDAYVDCSHRNAALCLVARDARDEPRLYRNTSADLPGLVALVDKPRPDAPGGTIRHYWVRTNTTDEGTRVAVERVERLTALYEYAATPVDQLPDAARGALAGNPRVTTLAGDHAYLVHHEGEWKSVERVRVQSAGVPGWAVVVRRLFPLLGAYLLGWVAVERRAALRGAVG